MKAFPFFGPVPHDIPLRHVATQPYKGGLVQMEYAGDRTQSPQPKKDASKKAARSKKGK